MGNKQSRTIDEFIHSCRLGDWKPPRTDKQLTWKEIKSLSARAIRVAETESEYWQQLQSESDRNSKSAKEELQKKHRQFMDESWRLYEQLMIQCWGWVEYGEKPRSVKIHERNYSGHIFCNPDYSTVPRNAR